MAHLILVTRMRFKSSRDSRAANGGAIGENARVGIKAFDGEVKRSGGG